jgi:palmitoyltransferase ZDHHC9/14/18
MQRNYRTFVLFANSMVVLCLYYFFCSLAMLFVRHRELVSEAEQRGESTDKM